MRLCAIKLARYFAGAAAMNHVDFALAHPVFDPERQITPDHFWLAGRNIPAGLTVNIGLE
jgi:hypothetical protein